MFEKDDGALPSLLEARSPTPEAREPAPTTLLSGRRGFLVRFDFSGLGGFSGYIALALKERSDCADTTDRGTLDG